MRRKMLTQEERCRLIVNFGTSRGEQGFTAEEAARLLTEASVHRFMAEAIELALREPPRVLVDWDGEHMTVRGV